MTRWVRPVQGKLPESAARLSVLGQLSQEPKNSCEVVARLQRVAGSQASTIALESDIPTSTPKPRIPRTCITNPGRISRGLSLTMQSWKGAHHRIECLQPRWRFCGVVHFHLHSRSDPVLTGNTMHVATEEPVELVHKGAALSSC